MVFYLYLLELNQVGLAKKFQHDFSFRLKKQDFLMLDSIHQIENNKDPVLFNRAIKQILAINGKTSAAFDLHWLFNRCTDQYLVSKSPQTLKLCLSFLHAILESDEPHKSIVSDDFINNMLQICKSQPDKLVGIRDTLHAFGRLEHSFISEDQIKKYEAHFTNFVRSVLIIDYQVLAHEYLRKPYVTDLQEKLIVECLVDPTKLYIYRLGSNEESYEQTWETINKLHIKPEVTQFLQESLNQLIKVQAPQKTIKVHEKAQP